jgi:hypothetical protein
MVSLAKPFVTNLLHVILSQNKTRLMPASWGIAYMLFALSLFPLFATQAVSSEPKRPVPNVCLFFPTGQLFSFLSAVMLLAALYVRILPIKRPLYFA